MLLYFYLKFERINRKWANAKANHQIIRMSVLLAGLSLIIFGIGNLYINKFKELFIQ